MVGNHGSIVGTCLRAWLYRDRSALTPLLFLHFLLPRLLRLLRLIRLLLPLLPLPLFILIIFYANEYLSGAEGHVVVHFSFEPAAFSPPDLDYATAIVHSGEGIR